MDPSAGQQSLSSAGDRLSLRGDFQRPLAIDVDDLPIIVITLAPMPLVPTARLLDTPWWIPWGLSNRVPGWSSASNIVPSSTSSTLFFLLWTFGPGLKPRAVSYDFQSDITVLAEPAAKVMRPRHRIFRRRTPFLLQFLAGGRPSALNVVGPKFNLVLVDVLSLPRESFRLGLSGMEKPGRATWALRCAEGHFGSAKRSGRPLFVGLVFGCQPVTMTDLATFRMASNSRLPSPVPQGAQMKSHRRLFRPIDQRMLRLKDLLAELSELSGDFSIAVRWARLVGRHRNSAAEGG